MSTTAEDAVLESGARAWPSRDAIGRASRDCAAAHVQQRRSLPKIANARRIRSRAKTTGHPVSAADLAQARHFDDILQAEIAQMVELVDSAETRWMGRRERGIDADRPPETLTQLRTRLEEAHRLIAALRDRFPHAYR